MRRFIGIDIGGTSIKYGLVNEDLTVEKDGSCKTPDAGQRILETICECVERLLTEAADIKAVCVSSAGIIDSENGVVQEANPALIPGYTGTRIGDRILKQFGLPCYVENDVNCAGMAEYAAGAAKGSSSMLMLTIGTGIGGAFIWDGKLWKGYGNSACEVGRMELGTGSFEELAATSALVLNTAKRLGKVPEEISGKWIFEQAQAGNEVCIQEIDRMCDALALGIANLCYVLNPEIVVLGGGISAQREWLLPRLKKGLERYLIPSILEQTRLEFAAFGNYAGMMGACCAAMQKQKSALGGETDEESIVRSVR